MRLRTKIIIHSIVLFAATMLSGITAAFHLPAWLHIAAAAVFLFANILPDPLCRLPARLKVEQGGILLLCAFLFLLFADIAAFIAGIVWVYGWFSPVFWIEAVLIFGTELVLFWNGITRIYLTSSMLGTNWRIIGILCGMIPIANIIVLLHIIRIAAAEVQREDARIQANESRKNLAVCRTRYPILLVHGIFFRDMDRFNYWGRIPEELEKNGAVLFYGNQQSSINVRDSGKEIADRIMEILAETGCEKVNIIAHSKGGLDSRYAISCLGMAPYVASLTTINTPHRGCIYAEWLLHHTPGSVTGGIANQYNRTFLKLGDTAPDFLGSVADLTAEKCRSFNEEVPDMPSVYYQSTGSKINTVMTNIFPLNFSNVIAKYFDGPNDGLVSLESAKWGERFMVLQSDCPDGISHGDVIDLMRHDKPDFDVREFYVQLVSDLKKRNF